MRRACDASNFAPRLKFDVRLPPLGVSVVPGGSVVVRFLLLPLAMIAAVVGTVLILAAPAHMQSLAQSFAQSLAQSPETTDAASQNELVIGTKDAPPFAMKAADGTWQGISVDLWRRVADELHLRYRFVEVPDVQGLDRWRRRGKVQCRRRRHHRDGRPRADCRFHAAVLRHGTWYRHSGRRRGKLAAHHPHPDVVRLCPSHRRFGRSGLGGRLSDLALRAAPQ